MNLVQKIRQLADAIGSGQNPLQTQKDWEMVGRLLSRTPAEPRAVAEALASRDAGALDAIVRRLENPQAAPPPTAPPVADFPPDDKAAALRAFKKRLRIMRLSDESKLGGRYTSGGRASKIDAIPPPEDFPPDIWKALAAEGRLVDTGQGFFALPK